MIPLGPVARLPLQCPSDEACLQGCPAGAASGNQTHDYSSFSRAPRRCGTPQVGPTFAPCFSSSALYGLLPAFFLCFFAPSLASAYPLPLAPSPVPVLVPLWAHDRLPAQVDPVWGFLASYPGRSSLEGYASSPAGDLPPARGVRPLASAASGVQGPVLLCPCCVCYSAPAAPVQALVPG